MSKVSVVIPTYNRAFCIKDAIKSAMNQTVAADEIIVADDCSTDNTEEVVKSFEDSRIKYYCLPENRGAGGARNYGVSKASGELIAFLDSDDCWTEDKLEKQLNLHKKNPELAMSYTKYLFHRVDGSQYSVPGTENRKELEGEILPYLLLRNSIGAPTVIIKKSVFEEINGFDETMDSLEDWDFAIRVARKYSIGYIDEPLLNVFQTSGSVSSSSSNYFANRCSFLGKYRKEYTDCNILNEVMYSILKKAEEMGVLEPVKRLIMLNLSE